MTEKKYEDLVSHRFYRDVSLDKIVGAEWNPSSRSNRKWGNKLTNSADEAGILDPLHVVDNGKGLFLLSDGHRRFATANRIELGKVPVTVHVPRSGVSPEEVRDYLFKMLNNNKMTLTGPQQTKIGLNNGPIYNPRIESTVKEMELLFTTEERASFLRPSIKVSPAVLGKAKKIVKYCFPGYTSFSFAESKSKIRIAFYWLLRYKDGAAGATLAMNKGMDIAKLWRYIEGSKPVTGCMMRN